MITENLNDKFKIIRKDRNPNSLFASFKVFKVLGHGGLPYLGERPPYPIINCDPMTSEVFYNLNKSDVLLGVTFLIPGFLGSLFLCRRLTLVTQKFLLTKYVMWWYALSGSFVAMLCSYYRLTGYMENGMRWRNKELLYSKYDFTRDFEERTIFKHFRERPE
jgi:hypothetical protein